ncbi:MAG: hypothetical protein ABWZ27_11850 [Aestuariivirgaceae bacterium]
MGVQQALNESDYEEIESAVMESPRGRWFLAEYSRRRGLDSVTELMDAMRRIEAAIREHAVPSPLPYPPYDGIGSRPAVRPAIPVGDADKRAEAIAQFNQIQAGLKSIVPASPQQDNHRPSESVTIDARHLRYFIEDEELFAPPAKPASGLPVVTSMTGALKERKRIIVIRRASSRDTAIPLADERRSEDEGATQP